MTLLQQRIESRLHSDDNTFIISYDEEDNLNFDLSQEYGLSELILKRKDSQLSSEYSRVVELVSIQINPRLRGQGLSKKVLGELTDWADMTNTILTGDPDDMFGTPIDVLYNLYGEFGFKRKEDTIYPYISHKIIRIPVKFAI